MIFEIKPERGNVMYINICSGMSGKWTPLNKK